MARGLGSKNQGFTAKSGAHKYLNNYGQAIQLPCQATVETIRRPRPLGCHNRWRDSLHRTPSAGGGRNLAYVPVAVRRGIPTVQKGGRRGSSHAYMTGVWPRCYLMKEWQDRVALVTGAAHGIGLEICRQLALPGVHIVAVDRDPKVQRVAESIRDDGGSAQGEVLDLADPVAIAGLFSRVQERVGRLDILVNNAAQQSWASITDLSVQEWDRMQAVCLRAPFLTMKHAIPLMQRRHAGVIINIASVHALVGYHRSPAYDSAKAGLVALTRQAAVDYSADGIRAVAISSALVVEDSQPDNPASGMFPVGRAGTPADIAALVRFLCSAQAGFINGTNLVVDGGLCSVSPAVYWHEGIKRA